MKNLLASLVLLALAFGCSTKEHHDEKAEWKELTSFHKIMAEAFHPLKDSGNVAPAKELASKLAEEAEHWASSSLPDKVNTVEMKSNLEKLKTDARSFADEVNKGATADVVKEKLTSLHMQFHKIMEAWQGGHHSHDDGEEGEHDEDKDHDDDQDKD